MIDDKWFKQQQRRVGVTTEDIAARAGRARSAVSNIYTGRQRMNLDWAKVFAEVLQVPLDEVLQRAGAMDAPTARHLSPGFSEGDVQPWENASS
ncbi:MAG: helix-turn-helix domain-containing protein [Paracoccus sp. (in: a-proteobacteria)]|uniref:helix-turn-helix domain-containing protein n=1 Tax=Paracoccus sp. TaxID=267 RepID=UPI0040580D8E